MNKEYREKNIKEMQMWDLQKKIEHSNKRIKEFYEKQNGKVYIAFSGGKDSTVLLHLVRSIYPNVIAVFSNTTNEYMEILKFIRTIENVITVHPKMTFKETIKNFGFPLVGKTVARQISDLKKPTNDNSATRNLYLTGLTRDGKTSKRYKLSEKWKKLIDAKFDITHKCCEILKKEPARRFEQETGLKGFVGTMAEESGERKKSWLKSGCNTYDGNNIKSRPLSIWTEKDIWEYIKKYNLPYCDIYDDVLDSDGNVLVKGEKRTGCAYCAFGANFDKKHDDKNRFERLALRKPHQFKKMMELENNGISFREALNFVGVTTNE